MSKHDQTDLRRRRLHVTDPSELGGFMLGKLPAGTVLQGIEFSYRTKSRPRCQVCNRRVHERGFVCLLASGERFIAGSKCGRDLFKVSWEQAEKAHLHLELLQDGLFLLDAHRKLLPLAISHIENWRFSLSAMAYWRTQAWQGAHPELFAAIEAACRADGGRLYVYSAPRQISEVERQRGSLRDDGRQLLGQLAGTRFFQFSDPLEAYGKAFAALLDARGKLTPDDRDLSKLRAVFRKVTDASKALGEVLEWQHAAFQMMGDANVRLVARLANARGFGEFQVVRSKSTGAFGFRDRLRPDALVRLPMQISPLSNDGLNILRSMQAEAHSLRAALHPLSKAL